MNKQITITTIKKALGNEKMSNNDLAFEILKYLSDRVLLTDNTFVEKMSKIKLYNLKDELVNVGYLENNN